MSSPAISYRRRNDLELRPIPEWRALLVYTPHRPDLHWLNAQAWMVLELADGSTADDMIGSYAREAEVSRDRAERVGRSCVDSLEGKGLVERMAPGHPPVDRNDDDQNPRR